jgi:hypothetical protein
MVEEGHFALVVGTGAGAEEHGAAKIERAPDPQPLSKGEGGNEYFRSINKIKI